MLARRNIMLGLRKNNVNKNIVKLDWDYGSEEDFDKIAELQKKGYEPLRSKSFYHGSPKQEFLYKSFAEVTGNRISDEESLKEQIYNADSELWTFLQTEISNWEEIVWR